MWYHHVLREAPLTDIAPHGLHHVTAIAADPQRNVDFYSNVLGLRLVKQTVNFDAAATWHLYYGDERGAPSSLLSFLPWPVIPRGRVGAGTTTPTPFSVPVQLLRRLHDGLGALRVHRQPRVIRAA